MSDKGSKAKKAAKLAPMESEEEQGNIIKFVDKDFEDMESRGKYDRKVFRRRSEIKREVKNVITQEDVEREEERDRLRKGLGVLKKPGMMEMIDDLGSGPGNEDFNRSFYLENKPKNLPPGYEPGKKNGRPINFSGDKFYVMVDLCLNGPDGLGWRSYRYDLFVETTQLIDLKILVENDLGYSYQDQDYYFNLKKLTDDVDLKNLDLHCDIYFKEIITLIMIPSNEPFTNTEKINRLKFMPVTASDHFPENGSFAKDTKEFLKTNIMKSLMFPPNRDWTEEFYVNYRKAKEMLQKMKQKDKLTTEKKQLGQKLNEDLAQLSIYTKGMQKTISEFEETAMKSIEIITKWEVQPHDINYIYGLGAKKYVMGGILIRECTFIYTYNRKIENSETIGELLKHKIEMMNRIRELTDDFIVPLVTMIEYYGRYYIAYAVVPIDLNTLVYGTITQNVVICNDLNDFPPLHGKGFSRSFSEEPEPEFPLRLGTRNRQLQAHLYLVELGDSSREEQTVHSGHRQAPTTRVRRGDRDQAGHEFHQQLPALHHRPAELQPQHRPELLQSALPRHLQVLRVRPLHP